MIRHLIVFNVPEGVTHEQCVAMAERGQKELGSISGVLQVSFGVAIGLTPRYKYNFTIDIRDKQALREYLDHPVHTNFATTYFRPLAPDRITTDYEVIY